MCLAQGLEHEHIKGLKRWFCLAKGLLLEQDKAGAGGMARFPFSPAACVAVGTRLVEALVRDRQEGLAVYYLDQCLDLPLGQAKGQGEGEGEEKGVSPPPAAAASPGALAVPLLARKAEVLLCMLDMHHALGRLRAGAGAGAGLSASQYSPTPGRSLDAHESLLRPRSMTTGSVYAGSSGVITGYKAGDAGLGPWVPPPSKKDTVESLLMRLQMPGPAWDDDPNPYLAPDPYPRHGHSIQSPSRNSHPNPGHTRPLSPTSPDFSASRAHNCPGRYPSHTPPMLFVAQSARQAVEMALAIVEEGSRCVRRVRD